MQRYPNFLTDGTTTSTTAAIASTDIATTAATATY